LFKNHKINKIGFHFDSVTSKWISNYDKLTTENIFSKISDLLQSKIINNATARNVSIDTILVKEYPELENIIKPYNPQTEANIIDIADKQVQRTITPRNSQIENSGEEGEELEDNKSEELNKNTLRINSKSTSRNYLIPKSCRIQINKPLKLNNIYRELRDNLLLDQSDKSVPNAVGVLFRVFLETSLDHYSQKKGRSFSKKERDNINTKIEFVIEELTNSGIESKKLENIKRVGSSAPEQSYLAIDNFHSYVHSTTTQPTSQELKGKWDNLQEFIEILWDEINKY